jgi:predicted TIM-barrel fold metal-dependent hydrolase
MSLMTSRFAGWLRIRVVLLLGVVTVAAGAYASQIRLFATPATERTDEQALKSFAALHPIDVHVHVFKTDPAFQAMLERLNLKLMDILVMDDTASYRKQLQPQVDDALALVKSSHGHVALCTTFDPYRFDSPSFTADAIKQIDRDFANGAVAVKVWKNIGMEIRDRSGKYVMADDEKFEPIYQDIASHGKTLMTHQAEPNVAWGPPDPADPSWSYYQENPQWYVGDKPGFPSKQMILAARDRVLGKNPKLRMVGVHLGSMEKSLDDIGRHLDQYPNFAIDTAGRMDYLMLMPREQVRNFLIKYQDRILYGTDLDVLPSANVPETLQEWQSTYARDWEFLATGDPVRLENKQVLGLNLPQPVLDKIFRDNAKRWIPGL